MSKICKKCNNKIPSYYRENGIKYKINNRSYCLNCHPFKSGIQEKRNSKNSNGKECVCHNCKKPFIYNRKKGYKLNTCNSCVQKLRDRKIKEKAIKYKGGKCLNCGYNKYVEVLEFHHRNPTIKLFNISPQGYRKSWEILKIELDKCDLLCANCHREVEYAGGARPGL